jgi:phasin family protein
MLTDAALVWFILGARHFGMAAHRRPVMTKTATAKSPKEEAHVFGAGAAMNDYASRSMAMWSEMSAFQKQTLEAWADSAQVAGRGFEALNSRLMAFQKKAMDDGIACAKSLAGVKSVTEAMDIQTKYAKTTFDSYVAEMNTVAETMAGVTKEAMKPLNERVTAFAGVFQAQR